MEQLEPHVPPTDAPQQPLVITADMLAPEAAAPAVRRMDFERGMSVWPALTLGIIAACVVVFGWQLASGALESEQSIIAAGALWKPDVLRGEVWRLASAAFLHGDPVHLVSNCVVLYILGMACEHAFGFGRTAIIYGVAAVTGGVMSLALTAGPSVGASGAIFGIAAAVVVFLYRFQNVFFVRDKRIGFVLLVWAGYTILTGFLNPQIDNFAHIGGFVGGAVMGAVLPRRRRPDLEPAFDVRVPPAAPQAG